MGIRGYSYGRTKAMFVSTWKTDNAGVSASTQVKLPLVSTGTYNMVVDWGDNSSSAITVWNQAETTHTYSSAGTYQIKIRGTCTGWKFNNTGDRLKILSVQQWGRLRIVEQSAFEGCANLTLIGVTDLPYFAGVNARTFTGCTSLTTINRSNEWDMSLCTSFNNFFRGCTNLNTAIGNWDVSAASDFLEMFRSCSNFNQNIGGWNMINATTLNTMFYLSGFNNGGDSSINNWEVDNVTDMNNTFRICPFNQPLNLWDTSSVNTMASMFDGNSQFNQNIGGWDISNVANFTNFMSTKTPATFSTANLDAIYNGWSALPSLQPNLTITFGTAKHTAGSSAGKAILTGSPNNWTITDGGI